MIEMEDKLTSLKETRNKINSYLQESENERCERKSKIKEVLIGFGDAKVTVISFNELSLFKIGARNEVNDGVFFEKTYQDENKIVFITYMMNGGSFGVHLHDCYEFCKILKGNLLERERQKMYWKNEEVIYAPNEIHRPYATAESVYEVTFYKEIK